MIWEVEEQVKVKIGEKEINLNTPLTPEKLKQIAKERGIRKFTVLNESGEMLTVDDFPVDSGVVYIREYNEAK